MQSLEDRTLADRIVVVTGGGTGIGAGIARALARCGCRVVVTGRREEPLRQLAGEVSAKHRLLYRTVDVGDRPSVEALFSWVVQEVGAVDILVNSAGLNVANRTMAAMDPEDWDRVLRINATGAYNCMLQVLPAMRQRGDGLVINVSSVAGKRAIQLGGVAYCASKFAMTALGTAVSNEVREEGVRITNVYPGEVNTPILENRPVPVSEEHRQSILQPEDIAAVVQTICALPPRAHVAEVVIKPTRQEWV